jgi:hypothetical protein
VTTRSIKALNIKGGESVQRQCRIGAIAVVTNGMQNKTNQGVIKSLLIINQLLILWLDDCATPVGGACCVRMRAANYLTRGKKLPRCNHH